MALVRGGELPVEFQRDDRNPSNATGGGAGKRRALDFTRLTIGDRMLPLLVLPPATMERSMLGRGPIAVGRDRRV